MNIDWQNLWLNDLDWSFAFEIVLRTGYMFLLVLVLLRLSGKKGVRQLSLFEVAIIISFGSAAGDPMFSDEEALIPSTIVLIVIVLLYRLITWLSQRSEKIESVFEGDPEYVIEDGMFVIKSHDKHTFAKDEFLSEMRQQSIEHLGQVRVAILETNGMVSFLFYEDEEVKYGMPVLPKPYRKMSKEIAKPGTYACTYCGNVQELQQTQCCARCDNQSWVEAINTKRIA